MYAGMRDTPVVNRPTDEFLPGKSIARQKSENDADYAFTMLYQALLEARITETNLRGTLGASRKRKTALTEEYGYLQGLPSDNEEDMPEEAGGDLEEKLGVEPGKDSGDDMDEAREVTILDSAP
ncbi:hypothetical protein FA13DRAFT_1716030 [Coprinellus micaceus]|uniref:Uncharacterized protein n=1 Tax=Coprinellus micaceus TaxID=71717 RepID=A0A4Y7SKX1_COPMI|nr:hypothetical protein FA13DRAFT_1716030 [Coprinellus micaceus]